MTAKHKGIRTCLFLTVAFFVVSGTAILAISYLPFELVKARIDALTYDGSAEPFTPALFENIVVKLRVIGIILLFAGSLLYALRRQAHQQLSNLIASFQSLSRELMQFFSKAVRGENKAHLLACIVIMMIAIGVRLARLFHPIEYDEAWTFTNYASKPLFIGLSYYDAPNNHLFHTLLVHVAYLLFGNHPCVIRLPAFFAGVLLVPASYVATRILYNKHAALLTAGLVAAWPALVGFSTNARGYTLICLIFMLTLSLATYLVRSENPAAWLFFAVLSALGFYTMPVMLYAFGIIITWLFFSIVLQHTKVSRKLLLKRLGITTAIVTLLTLLFYAPVFIVSGLNSVVSNPSVAAQSSSDFLAQLPGFIRSVWRGWNSGIPSVITFLMVIGFLTSLLFHGRLTPYRVPVILPIVISLVAIFIIHPVVRFTRVWLFLLPLYIALACSGLLYLLKPLDLKIAKFKPIMFAILPLLLSSWLALHVVSGDSKGGYTLRDAEAITIFLKEYLKPGDGVISQDPSSSPLIYYFDMYEVPLSYYLYNVPVKNTLYDIPTDYLPLDLSDRHRILVVVNETFRQTLAEVLDKHGLSSTDLGVPKVVKRFKSATLYEMQRTENIRRNSTVPQDPRY
jgi:hypothetical protein